MTLFTVYEPTTGAIIRSGVVALESDADLQAEAGESVLIGVRGEFGMHTVVDGQLVDIELPLRGGGGMSTNVQVASTPEPTDIEVLVEALKAKGVVITAADLAAARLALVPSGSPTS